MQQSSKATAKINYKWPHDKLFLKVSEDFFLEDLEKKLTAGFWSKNFNLHDILIIIIIRREKQTDWKEICT